MPSPPEPLFASPHLFIRRARPSDTEAVSRICLLTSDAGNSSEANHTIGELPGLVYAVPYLHLPHAGGFVLVDPVKSSIEDERLKDDEGNDVVAYLVFANDTEKFFSAQKAHWYPALCLKYPRRLLDTLADTRIGHARAEQHGVPAPVRALSDRDTRYIKLLHAPDPPESSCLAFSPAHLHINILPPYQRQGWGRKLVGNLVTHLRDDQGLQGVWLGMDPNNRKAAVFYNRVGFRHENVDGAPPNYVGLKFDDWKD